jgi:DNA repair exonuclease SbcCD ATPase subunit
MNSNNIFNITIEGANNNLVKKIYHISDIHINLFKKHDEYIQVFNNLYKFLKNEVRVHRYNIGEGVIIVTGDILHSKTELSPECIRLTYDLFWNLSLIMPVIIIAGNHDANLSNKNRLDSLTPIIGKLDSDSHIPFFYLKDTGVYRLSNILFGVTSVFDYTLIKASELPDIGCIKVALFHGRVNGAITDTGVVLEGEIDNSIIEYEERYDNDGCDYEIEENSEIEEDIQPNIKINNKITCSSFDGYDFVLLGDIHKYQYLNKQCSIGYAGSLIQQNHGESSRNHGVLVWDLETGKSELIEIKNKYGYFTVKIRNETDLCLKCCLPNLDTQYYLKNNMKGSRKTDIIIKNDCKIYRPIKNEYEHHKICPIPDICRLRIEFGHLSYSQQENIISIIKLNHQIIETQFKQISQDETIEQEINQLTFNVKDTECQNNFLEKYFSTKIGEKDKISSDELTKIKKLNEDLNKNLSSEHGEHLNWKLCKLEFDNLFSYGAGNTINFNTCHGVVGIIAPNHTGKSAIIDIIMYCLFNKFSRKGDIKDMINVKSTSFQIYLVFQVGHYLYHVTKKGEYLKNKTRRGAELPVKVDFYRTDLDNDNKYSLKEEKPKDTMNKIIDYVGQYDDMILTSVSLQNNNTNFIDITDTPRKAEMEKILKIDVFTELKDKASKIVNDKKTVFKYLKNLDIVGELTTKVHEAKIKKDTLHKLKDILYKLEENVKIHSNKFDIAKQNKLKLEGQSNSELWTDIISKCRINEIGFQINRSDLNKLNNLQLIELYDTFDEQWKSIGNINKLDWINLQKTMKKMYTLLVSIVEILDDMKHQFDDNDNINIDMMKDDLTNFQSSLNELHSSLIPLDSNIDIDLMKTQLDNLDKDIENVNNNISKYPEENEDILYKIKLIKESIEEYNELVIGYNDDKVKCVHELDVENEEWWELRRELLTKSVNDIKKEIHDCHRSILTSDVYKSFKSKITTLLEDIQNLVPCNDMTNEIEELEQNIKKYNKKLTKCESKKTSMEFKKNQMYQDYQKHEHNLNKLEWKRNNIEKDMKHYHKNLKTNKKIKKTTKEIKTLNNQIDNHNLSAQISKYGYSAVTLANVTNKYLHKIKSHEGDYIRYRTLSKQFDEEEQLYNKIVSDRDKTKEAYYQLKSEVKLYAKEIIELSNKKNEIHTIETEIKLYQNYLEAVKNIPYMLIQSVKPLLEQMINEMLSHLVDFTIYFDIKDNKHISIYLKRETEKHRREILLSNASGFEKFIGGLFIRIALINISNLPKPNFLFIDEGWGCFDSNNINNIGLIFDYLKTKFDFVLTISHLQELRQHLTQQIILTREDGWSHVNY